MFPSNLSPLRSATTLSGSPAVLHLIPTQVPFLLFISRPFQHPSFIFKFSSPFSQHPSFISLPKQLPSSSLSILSYLIYRLSSQFSQHPDSFFSSFISKFLSPNLCSIYSPFISQHPSSPHLPASFLTLSHRLPAPALHLPAH